MSNRKIEIGGMEYQSHAEFARAWADGVKSALSAVDLSGRVDDEEFYLASGIRQLSAQVKAYREDLANAHKRISVLENKLKEVSDE